MPLTERETAEFLEQPLIGVLATVGPDGQPHAVPTWYVYEEGELVMHASPRSRRVRDLRGNDRATFCVDTKSRPYQAVIVWGQASVTVDTDDERLRRMAVRYQGQRSGEAYADSLRGVRMAIIRLRPERVISWDYGRGDRPG